MCKSARPRRRRASWSWVRLSLAMLERKRSGGATRAKQVVFVSPQAQWNGDGSRDPPVGRRNNAGRKAVWVACRERPPGARKISANHRGGVPWHKARNHAIGNALAPFQARAAFVYIIHCGVVRKNKRVDLTEASEEAWPRFQSELRPSGTKVVTARYACCINSES